MAARGAVSTPHHEATGAAQRALEAGGNAVDAALAAAAMLTVVYPNQCALGGDLIALVGTPDGAVHAVNASGRAPRGVDVEAVRRTHASMPVDGPLAVTVPGIVAGWETMHRRWGSTPWSDALAEAERAASEGVAVSVGLSRGMGRERLKIEADQGLRQLLQPDGEWLRPGSMLRQPTLARSLAALRSQGAEAMYDGELAQAIVRELRARGSAVTMDDFRQHRVEVGEGARVRFADCEYLSTAGNSQGLFFLAGVKALDALRADGHDLCAGRSAGAVARILAQAALDRDRLLGDDGRGDELTELILGDPHIDAMLSAEGVAPGAPFAAANGDTVGVAAADGSGLWVSLLQSVFHGFGSGILEPHTGIILQNRGAAFTLRDGAPNTLAAGRRPPHTLMPVLVRRAGRVVASRAVMGGRAQPAIQTELMLSLARGASPQDAVSEPRWVLQAGELGVDPLRSQAILLEDGTPPSARHSLAEAGFEVTTAPRYDDEFGHAHIVESDGATLTAGSDPRADGSPKSAQEGNR